MKTKKIFTRRLAVYLRKRGFNIVNTTVNSNKPEYDIYFFEDTVELQEAIGEFMQMLMEEKQKEKSE